MANLGFQAVLRILNDDPRVTVERAFLPDGPRPGWPRTLRTFESDRPLGDFDVLAFSISFETDYLHVLDILALAGLPLRREARGRAAPLVLAGGPAIFLNPEPIAEFVDLFLIGEAEEMLPEFLARAAAGAPGRAGLLECTEDVVGAYRPDRYRPRYGADGALAAFDYDGPFAPRVVRRYLARLDESRDDVAGPDAGSRLRRHVPGRGRAADASGAAASAPPASCTGRCATAARSGLRAGIERGLARAADDRPGRRGDGERAGDRGALPGDRGGGRPRVAVVAEGRPHHAGARAGARAEAATGPSRSRRRPARSGCAA